MASKLRLKPREIVRVRSRRHALEGSPLELARRFKQQLDAGEFQTGLALARAHGLSPSTVSRLIAVLDMPAPLQKLVDAGMRLQTAARIHALNPAEFSRVIRGLNAGQSIRALLGESKPRVKRIPRRGTRKLREAFAARLVEARLRLGVTQMELGALLCAGSQFEGRRGGPHHGPRISKCAAPLGVAQ